MKYKEIVYMILDELKLSTDDAFFTEEHVRFLATKYRNQLIKQYYSDVKKEVPQSYYQCVTLDMQRTNSVDGVPCVGETYLKSKQEMPLWLPVANPTVFPVDIMTGINCARIPINRMKFTGSNKWLTNIIYFAFGPSNRLYAKSSNPQFLYLEKVSVYAVFEDPEKADAISCCGCESDVCDIMDKDFPMEEALVPILIKEVVKELLGPVFRPEDTANNASDDMPTHMNQAKNTQE